MEAKKLHFVLVHGSSHGAWCWFKVVALLKLAGHQVSALDLAASGINTKQVDELESIHDYVQPLMKFFASLAEDERVILVGHSYGGFAISLAMENFPEKIEVAVFVTAYMPNCCDPPATLAQEFFKRATAESVLDCQITFGGGLENLPVLISFGPIYLETLMYKYCQPEDLELTKTVMRPFKFLLEDLNTKESVLSEARYGSVKRVFIVCKGDAAVNEDYQQWNIENSPPNEVKFINEAGHMAMLSKPKELCQCLLEIAEQY